MIYHGKLPATIEQVDYAVPTHYSIGERFATMAEAIEAAKATIEEFRYVGQHINRSTTHREERDRRKAYQDGDTLVVRSRAFVHVRELVRWADGSTSDRVVDTVEVYLPPALREAARV